MSLLPMLLVCSFAPAPFPRPGTGAYLGADFIPGRTDLTISSVYISSPALEAGLGGGDVIVAVDGTRLQTQTELGALLQRKKPGATVTVMARRGPQEMAVKVKLGKPVHAHLGASFANTLQVNTMVAESPARRAGVQLNDVIVAIDGKTLATPAELVAYLKDRKPGDTVTLCVRRNKAEVTIKVTLGKRPGY